MTIAHFIVMAAAFALICAGGAAGQTKDSASSETAPPKLAVLVYQRFPLDKTVASAQALAAAARACANLDVPNSWIVMDSVTGEPEVLAFDPFDSFAHIDKAFAAWGPIYAAHPELAKAQAQINGALASQRTIIAMRRDDLSYRADRIDLSKARFLRVLEVRLRPGREGEFAEAFQKLRAAYEKIDSDLPWAVYQVNVGTPSPAFFAFVPMRTLGRTMICWISGRSSTKRKAKPRSGCNRLRAKRTRKRRATSTPSAPKSLTSRKSLRQAIRNFGRQNLKQKLHRLLRGKSKNSSIVSAPLYKPNKT